MLFYCQLTDNKSLRTLRLCGKTSSTQGAKELRMRNGLISDFQAMINLLFKLQRYRQMIRVTSIIIGAAISRARLLISGLIRV